MALPKKVRPEYSTTIPSTGKKIKYQPFSVREEKVLMLAAQGENNDEIANAVTNVLEACVTSPADFKVADLALFDIEYLFLKARGRSIGETIKLKVSDPDDDTFVVDHEINLDKIGIVRDEKHTDIIDLGDTQVKMRYPGISFFAEGVDLEGIDGSVDTAAKCVSQIIMGEDVYNSGDMTNEEIVDWMDDLTTEEFNKLLEFFSTMPKLSHKFTLKNTKTGKDFTIVLEGLRDFF